MVIRNIEGWSIDRIDDTAYELIQALSEMGIPSTLGFLGLCRALTILGDDEDLDMACKLIDDFSELGTPVAGLEDE